MLSVSLATAACGAECGVLGGDPLVSTVHVAPETGYSKALPLESTLLDMCLPKLRTL